MFTIKLMRYNQDGSIIDADILSCPSYSVVYSNEKVEIVPRAMTEGDPTHSMRTIMPRPMVERRPNPLQIRHGLYRKLIRQNN